MAAERREQAADVPEMQEFVLGRAKIQKRTDGVGLIMFDTCQTRNVLNQRQIFQVLCKTKSFRLDPAQQISQGSTNDLGSLQPGVQFELFQNSQIPLVESNSCDFNHLFHSPANLAGNEPQLDDLEHRKFQTASTSNTNDIQEKPEITAVVTASEVGHTASIPALQSTPLDWLFAPKVSSSLSDRVLARLVQAEAHEPNIHLRSDYRQAFIALTFAGRGSVHPFVDASYEIYGCHPDKVWDKIQANRHAKLAAEYDDFYDAAGNLKPDIPKIPSASAIDLTEAIGHSADLDTQRLEDQHEMNGNRVSPTRTGPMRVEIGVSRAALRSECKPRITLAGSGTPAEPSRGGDTPIACTNAAPVPLKKAGVA